ncbi:MAG TPA: alpha/beta fold hydrolase [Deltaproteobacteria bacterium]|nr:alpha/beta fold hydrolase [Deltaproteobacteria bacterium]HOM30080.1 alpha/beta fold hydrolase [Deltaproteobacteria bacterium]
MRGPGRESNGRFMPPYWLRGAYTQTVLASSRVRAVGAGDLEGSSREITLTVTGGVRLVGSLSHSPGRKGLVILLHGWEGSARSTYILHAGRFFHRKGYSVFRLNFRDHGDTHHLNEGLFRAVMLDEVFQAVSLAAGFSGEAPCYLMGFSLGGNFALRIARHCAQEPITHLRHVLAVSPVIDPSHATDAIDRSPLLRWYFVKKWRRSLRRKQELFPSLYDFSAVLAERSVRAMTEALFSSLKAEYDTEGYFRSYAIHPETLEDVTVPTTIVTAQDDPAIPVEDFSRLRLSPAVSLVIHDFGGHNGFLEGLFGPTWCEREALRLFDADSTLRPPPPAGPA